MRGSCFLYLFSTKRKGRLWVEVFIWPRSLIDFPHFLGVFSRKVVSVLTGAFVRKIRYLDLSWILRGFLIKRTVTIKF